MYLEYDEFYQERSKKDFLKDFTEEKIKFGPTFKRNSFYITNEIPSYPERILYYGYNIDIDGYNSFEGFRDIDRYPVYLTFEVDFEKLSLHQNLILVKKSFKKNYSPKEKFSVEKVKKSNIDWEITDFEFKESLEANEKMIVKKCIHKFSKKEYSATFIPMKNVNQQLLKELEFLMILDSPFIVKLHKIFKIDGNMILIKDLLDSEDLYNLLDKKLDENEVKFYISQMILALKAIHSMNIVHRDIKPENIMITKEGNLKLTNFQLSKLITKRAFTKCGTIDYLSPEVILDVGHNKSVDFWSLGILTFELLCGYPPFTSKTDNEMNKLSEILNGKLEFPEFLPQNARDFISGLLKRNKTKRLGCLKNGIEDLIKHPWLKGINWKMAEQLSVKPPYFPDTLKNRVDESFFGDFEKLLSPDKRTSLTIFEEENESPLLRGKKFVRIRKNSDNFVKEKLHDIFEVISKDDNEIHVTHEGKKRSFNSDDVEEVLLFKGDYILKKQYEVLNEFIQTEKLYVSNLNLIIDEFFLPLTKILSDETHKKIFSSIQTIFKLNSTFLDSLEKVMSTQSIKNIPFTISSFIKTFKLYTDYIQNYDLGFNTINNEKNKNPKLQAFLNEKYESLMKRGINVNLGSLLIMPIQRLPKYLLLCEELLKNSPEEEKELLEKSILELKDIVFYCNEKKREYENLLNLCSIQKKYSLPLDISQFLIVEKKKNENLQILERDKLMVLKEFIILKDMILLDSKTKGQIKVTFEQLKFTEIEMKELKGFEFVGKEEKIKVFMEEESFTRMKDILSKHLKQ